MIASGSSSLAIELCDFFDLFFEDEFTIYLKFFLKIYIFYKIRYVPLVDSGKIDKMLTPYARAQERDACPQLSLYQNF